MFGQKLMADNPKKQKMWVTISIFMGCSPRDIPATLCANQKYRLSEVALPTMRTAILNL
jgi:hypothetical protein